MIINNKMKSKFIHKEESLSNVDTSGNKFLTQNVNLILLKSSKYILELFCHSCRQMDKRGT